ncbi:MAG: DegT/DnrJ/EryC1/StrS family aminotransferase [Deltaproteobacteria bacterium]|nr:DegT/DnrJ/EryC1/StrS family aminotransferase [Deltaproteobacteria bacterium]
MTIQSIPLSQPEIDENDILAVNSVLKTPFLSLGPKQTQFEEAFARYLNVNHCQAVSSGTAALHLILSALDIKDGDEVITSPFSFIASANSILFNRALPVFCDIDAESFNLDIEKIESKITDKTKAILAVDVFGFPMDMEKLKNLADKYKLRLIEDACEALGAKRGEINAGSYADAAAFGFYPNKQMTTGEGGIVASNNETLVLKVKSLKNQGRSLEDNSLFVELGYNYRLSDINCALGLTQLDKINKMHEKRDIAADYYQQLLAEVEEIIPPYAEENVKRSWFVYVIELKKPCSAKKRDFIMKYLQANEIGCGKYFPAIHLQPFYTERFGYKEGDFPICESLAQRTIALPFFANMTWAQQKRVVDVLKEALSRA